MTAADARLVEEAFAGRVTTLEESQNGEGSPPASASAEITGTIVPNGEPPTRVDKNVLTFGEPRRRRDKAHLAHVSAQSCLICGRRPSDPHHLRFAQPRALGRKVSDEFTVPLCRTHHRLAHNAGKERAWWPTPALHSKLGAPTYKTERPRGSAR